MAPPPLTAPGTDDAPVDPREDEVFFLVLHHLHQYASSSSSSSSIRAALVALEGALHAEQLLPLKWDYMGVAHAQSYEQLAARYAHVPPTYLLEMLRSRLPCGQGALRTLLATGRHSTMLRKRPRGGRKGGAMRNGSLVMREQGGNERGEPFGKLAFVSLPKAYRRLKRLVGHHLSVYTTIFDHSSGRMVTGSDDQLIKVWSTETGYLQHTLRGHNSNIIEIVKHPTSPIFVSASSDSTLRVWNISTGAALHVLDGGSKEVNVVQFSPCPDRPYLVSGGADGSVRLWNADNFEAGYIRVPLPERSRRRAPVANSADTVQVRGATAAATSRAVPSSPIADVVQTAPSGVGTVSVSPVASNRAVLVPGATPTVVTTGGASVSAAATGQLTGVRSAARQVPEQQISQSRNLAANSMVSGTPDYEVLSVCFNAGATRLVVGGTDCNAYVYSIEKPTDSDSPFPQLRLLTVLRGHSEQIIQVLFSRWGDSIVTACRDGTARIWNRTKARLPANNKRKESVSGMGQWSSKILDCRTQLQADARSMLSGGATASACGSIVPRMRRQIFPVSVGAAMWSLTDKYVFTASSDAKIRVWHADTGKLARVLEAHEAEVYVMDCHPTNSRILLSAGYDGKCILWDIETGAQLRSFFVGDEQTEQAAQFGAANRPKISDGQFAPDGLSFALCDRSGAVTLFGFGSGESTALAPEEQFFSNDCAPFRRDAQNRALDENTGLLLHLLPKGRLCDKEFRVYPPELQPTVPLPTLPKYENDIYSARDDAVAMELSSPRIVENRNRDALLLRAREFRENQEKEERRLLREARDNRRRLIIAKEKALLERDTVPFQLALRDFAVLDSDVEESDADFDCAAEMAQTSGESSSSSEDEAEVRPRRKNEKRRQRSRPLGVRQRRPGLRSRQPTPDAANNSDDSEPGGEGDGEESPAYELESEESESDGSLSSRERNIRNDYRTDSKYRRSRLRRLINLDEKASTERRPSKEARATAEGIVSPALSAGSPPQLAPHLEGAVALGCKRRMRISVANRSIENMGSPSSHPNERSAKMDDRGMTNRANIQANTSLTQRNLGRVSSMGSYDGRAIPQDDHAFVGLQVSMNPSFTSERKNRRIDAQRVPKSIEDHQGDTASYVRSGRSGKNGADGHRYVPINTQQHSSIRKSRGTGKGLNEHGESEIKGEFADGLNATVDGVRDGGHEKSLLSDSPARLSKKNLRSQSRNSACALDDVITPVVNIDELAERELEILEAERDGHWSRKRRGNTIISSSEEDSFEKGAKRSKRARHDEGSDVRRKSKSRRKRIEKSESGDSAVEAPARVEEEGRRALSSSAWLRSSSSKYTFLPQLGDDVMYFPEGHASAMEISREAGLEPLAERGGYKKVGKEMLDGTSIPKGAAPARFQIIDVEYEFAPSSTGHRPRSMYAKGKSVGHAHKRGKAKRRTMMVLTLRPLSDLRRRAGQCNLFVLLYYPVDAPEYLVLTSRVEAALNRSWKPFDRCRILFLNERRQWQYYTGTIRNVTDSVRSVMWNSVEVEYDNEGEKEKGTCELVSPWELEPYDLLQGAREAPLQFSQLARPSTVEPGLFPFIAKEFEAIGAVDADWQVQLSWLDSVDALAARPGYCNKVPLPMDLDTVRVRMCTGFYRHFCSFLHDVNLLKRNAVSFHGRDSESGLLSIRVFTRLCETAERTRQHFVNPTLSMSQHVTHSHLGSNNRPSARPIGPRPTVTEATGSGLPVGSLNTPNEQTFSVPVLPRQPPTAFAMPSQFMTETTHGQRAWLGLRPIIGGTPALSMFPGQSPGISLPPALPGVAAQNTTAPRTPSRGTRAASRGQQQMRWNQYGQSGRAGVASSGNGLSSTMANASNFQHTAGHALTQPPVISPPFSASGQYHQSRPPSVVNSSHTNEVRQGVSTKLAPSHSLTYARATAKPGHNTRCVMQTATHMLGSDNGSANNMRGYVASAAAFPSQDGLGVPNVTGAAMSATQPSPHIAASRQQPRGASMLADGGTHSWGRSMEGAGGIFALQASTSDSHLPIPAQAGRSRSPTSPPCRAEMPNPRTRRQAATGTNSRAPPFHEHSTISVAAAESTMSCGGADVAMQAATAESAEVATGRTRKTR